MEGDPRFQRPISDSEFQVTDTELNAWLILSICHQCASSTLDAIGFHPQDPSQRIQQIHTLYLDGKANFVASPTEHHVATTLTM